MAELKPYDPIDDLRRHHKSREPETEIRRWIPWSEHRAVDVGSLDPPPINPAAADLIIPIIGTNHVEIIVSQPETGGISNLDPATGDLEDITNWSGRLWLAGGRYNPNLIPPVDELLWAKVNGANFEDMGSDTFTERFHCSAYYFLHFQIYAITGAGTLYITIRPT